MKNSCEIRRNGELPIRIIKDIKKRVGLSNTDIGNLMGISFMEVYNIESGKHSPHLLTRKKLFKLHRKILKRLGESSSKLYM